MVRIQIGTRSRHSAKNSRSLQKDSIKKSTMAKIKISSRFSFHIQNELRRRLEEQARKEGRSLANIVSRILDAYYLENDQVFCPNCGEEMVLILSGIHYNCVECGYCEEI